MNGFVLPNRDLLNAKFESYKLSLKKGLIITSLENEGVDLRSLPQNEFSKLTIHLFSLHNCLFQDRHNPRHIYYFTPSGKIKALVVSTCKEAFSSGKTVFHIPHERCSDLSMVYNASLICLDNYVLVCSGSDHIYLLNTGDRSSDVLSSWRVAYDLQVDLASKAGYLVDAVVTHIAGGQLQIDYVCTSVYTSDPEKPKVHVDWFTLSQTNGTWSQTRHRRLFCSTFPDHIAFEGSASSLTVLSTQCLSSLLDTLNPNIKPLVSESPAPIKSPEIAEESDMEVRFTWTQSLPSMPEGDSTLLNLLLRLSSKLQIKDPKHAVSIVCKPCENKEETLTFHRLDVTIHTEEGDIQLCSARLFAPVSASGTMWTYDRQTNSIDVTLVKEEAGTWPRLFADLDEERRLGVRYDEESLPAASVGAPNEPMQSCFNVEQLEDVDMVHDDDEDDAVLQRIDGETLKTVLRAEMIGHKLYTALTRFDASLPNCSSHLLCTRYDVDGLIWAPQAPASSSTDRPWSHVATLQAFGYVLASKQNRRFVASPPIDLTRSPCTPQFVAVADITRHIYVYWQPAKDALTELRRRKPDGDSTSGSRVVHVGWQQVVALPDSEEIIGFAAVAGEPYAACVVATKRSLYLICLEEGEEL